MGKVIERLRNDARIRLIRTAWPAVRRAASGMLRLVVGTPRLAIARFQVSRQNWDGVIRTLAPHVRHEYPLSRSARVVISGSIDQVCAELDRLAALEAAP